MEQEYKTKIKQNVTSI